MQYDPPIIKHKRVKLVFSPLYIHYLGKMGNGVYKFDSFIARNGVGVC